LKSEADITALAAVQARLLKHAMRHLKPGGHLVYATCSLEPEEGEEQIRALLAERNDIGLLPIQADKLGIPPEAITPQGMLRTLPFHAGGMDGFFAARIALTS
jgi:16S rRNA (cytosine967-C5)-methyltransferase